MLSHAVFKANDIRGVFGDEWDADGARAIGHGYARLVEDKQIIIGRDMRVTGRIVADAFTSAVVSAGIDVVDIGLASTDELWFASGFLDLPGVQITSSHNPAAFNGMKFCRSGARPVDREFLHRLESIATELDATPVAIAEASGTVTTRDMLPDYVDYLLRLVDIAGMRRLKVVVDAGNGMGGHIAPAVLGNLNVEVIGLFMDLDGSFPNHQPNPLEPQNLVDAQKAVLEFGADCAIVFDGDADRVFIIDELGGVVSPSAITAMIAASELKKEPGAAIVINTITSASVREIVEELGGRVVPSHVGHTYMKAHMAATNAVFGGEHSGHYYFREFFGADTGMLAALHVLAELGHSSEPLSRIMESYGRYETSGEINSPVDDALECMRRVAENFSSEGSVEWGDGVKITGDSWWISLRLSNTESLLRLNVEASSASRVDELTSRVLALIREES